MSDSNMLGSGGIVVGTAGHIDHGKTTLVRALTGMDTDTLKEEKLRGISIDLGFANMSLPGCPPVSFIDVPGHERFIKNMLAGVAGIEAVLLVVASDEGVKPQTREHFDICRLLGIRQGIIALTKSDLATAEQLQTTTTQVKSLVKGSFLQDVPIIPLSAVTGDGLPQLREQLCGLSRKPAVRDNNGVFRLAVDRSFARKGFGAVITGTLASGTLRVGDSIQIYPRKISARVRSLQVHHAPVQSASAGSRVAVNLAGVEHSAIQRGDVLAPPGALEVTRAADVSITWLDPLDLPSRRRQIVFHGGTSEVMATIKMNAAFARLDFAEPLLLLPGDRFVLRLPSPARTIAGGSVLDPFPPRRLNRAKTLVRLAFLENDPSLFGRVRILVAESKSGLSIPDLVRMTGTIESVLVPLVSNTSELVLTSAGLVLTRAWIDQKRQALVQWLLDFHLKNPGAAGAPLSLARAGLDAPLADTVFAGFAAIRVQGDLVALASHRAQFSAADTQLMQNLEDAFRVAGFQPPPAADVLKNSADGKRAAQLLEVLVKSQRLVRISNDLIFHTDVVTHIRTSLSSHKGRRFSVPEFKSWIDISRKYAIPLLEFLDSQRVTRRDGDMRVVL